MKIETFEIEGPRLIVPKRFEDSRGWFSETWNYKRDTENGILDPFVQDNMSYSRKAGTIRGLHFQRTPSAQAKLVMALKGSILDIAVDIRLGSRTFGQYIKLELNAEDGAQFYIPEGFAHGFCTQSDDVIVTYKTSNFYSPEHEGGIHWNDPDLEIPWNIGTPILSEKDEKLPFLKDIKFE